MGNLDGVQLSATNDLREKTDDDESLLALCSLT